MDKLCKACVLWLLEFREEWGTWAVCVHRAFLSSTIRRATANCIQLWSLWSLALFHLVQCTRQVKFSGWKVAEFLVQAITHCPSHPLLGIPDTPACSFFLFCCLFPKQQFSPNDWRQCLCFSPVMVSPLPWAPSRLVSLAICPRGFGLLLASLLYKGLLQSKLENLNISFGCE